MKMCESNDICHAFYTKIMDEESIKWNIVLNTNASSQQTHALCWTKEYHNKLNTLATDAMFSFNEVSIYTGKFNILIKH